MTSIIIAYRDVLYYAKVPDMSTLLQAFGLGMVALIIGVVTFTKLKRQFAEIIMAVIKVNDVHKKFKVYHDKGRVLKKDFVQKPKLL